MTLRASDIIIPLKHFIDWLIEDYGVYLYMGFACLSLIAIAWILSGGLRRGGSAADGYAEDESASVGLIIYPLNPPSTPPPLESGINLDPPHDPDRDCD
jgi:hypothetical protein